MAGLAALLGALATLRRRDARYAVLAEDVTAVRAQVEHNHGSSIKDAITRIESPQSVMLRDLTDSCQDLAALHRDLGATRQDLSDARRDHDERLHVVESAAADTV
ncbi:hypothetical protein [Actinomyces faecalis]|uniref:hypothetical protein n=1 Tax=Actinomyces faecalis TaxID=2722820 RepID=UPI001556C8B2|nr:hypothetical protein [Actinomyces faecalis]